MIDAISSSASATSTSLALFNANAAHTQQPKDLAEAAKQFEALLLHQLLQMAHGDENGWLGSGDDASAAPAIGMAEESLAQGIAKSGGLGLSAVIVHQLTKR
jgi:Rod binding domain-containing protein